MAGMTEDTREAQRAVLLPVCWVSLGCGQRQESQSIWSPFACPG